MSPSVAEKRKNAGKHSRNKSKSQPTLKEQAKTSNSSQIVANIESAYAHESIFEIPSTLCLNIGLISYASRCGKATHPLFGNLVSQFQVHSTTDVILISALFSLFVLFVVPKIPKPKISLRKTPRNRKILQFSKYVFQLPSFNQLPQVYLYVLYLFTLKNAHQFGQLTLNVINRFPSPAHATSVVYGLLLFPFAVVCVDKSIKGVRNGTGGFVIALTAGFLKLNERYGLGSIFQTPYCLLMSSAFEIAGVVWFHFENTKTQNKEADISKTLTNTLKSSLFELVKRSKSSIVIAIIITTVTQKLLPETPRSFVTLPFQGDTLNPHTGIDPNRQMVSDTTIKPIVLIQNSTDSTTGQIVVGDMEQDETRGYSLPMRYLRIDHFLVGGLWMPNYPELDDSVSIYPFFYVQEAAQYVVNPFKKVENDEDESEDNEEAEEKSAILLGLGIGAATHGLVASGFQVSIVEKDQAVYDAAVEFLGVDPNLTAYITDAKDWISEYDQRESEKPRYDIVIHDLFTGTDGPEELLSPETFTTIRDNVLTPETGVLAVNIYGSLNRAFLLETFLTLQTVFADKCDLFHDKIRLADGPESEEIIEIGEFDDMNFVAICRQKYKGEQDTGSEFNIEFDKKSINKSAKRNMRGVILTSMDQRRLPTMTTDDLAIRLNKIYEDKEHEDVNYEEQIWGIMGQVLPEHAWLLY